MRQIRNLSAALSVLARAQADEIDMHAEVDAFHAPSECHGLVARGEHERDRRARKHAEAIARAPMRIIRAQAKRRGGFDPASADPKWQAIVARCSRTTA